MMYLVFFQRATCGVFFELFDFEPISPEVSAMICGTASEMRIVMYSLRTIFGTGFTEHSLSHVYNVASELLFLVSCQS